MGLIADTAMVAVDGDDGKPAGGLSCAPLRRSRAKTAPKIHSTLRAFALWVRLSDPLVVANAEDPAVGPLVNDLAMVFFECIRRCAVACSLATAVAITSTTAPARADDTSPLFELVDAATQRLQTADPVAASKWLPVGRSRIRSGWSRCWQR